MSESVVLIVGVRRACYRAALALGRRVLLWSDGPLGSGRKRELAGWIETPFAECEHRLVPAVLRELERYRIEAVLGVTESSVVLASRVRRHIGLPRIAPEVVERFHDKLVMKRCAAAAGIPITRYREIGRDMRPEDLARELGFPIVLKHRRLSGARDIVVAHDLVELAAHSSPGRLAEAFVHGSELSIESFVVAGEIVFVNLTRYVDACTRALAPATLEPRLHAEVLGWNQRVIADLGVDHGMTHAEFYLTERGPVFGEVALRPPGGYFMDLIGQSYGFDPWREYVKLELGLAPEIVRAPRAVSGVYMIWPEPGVVRSIEGAELLGTLPGVTEHRFRLAVGARVPPRSSTSDEKGHVLVQAGSESEVLAAFERIRQTLRIEVEP